MDETHALHTATGYVLRVKSSADEARTVVARLARGDVRALDELYASFGAAVFRYLLTFVPDRRLAEEVLQDTFVAAWRGADGYGGRSGVKTWLFGIARRRAHDSLRRRGLELVAENELVALVDPEPRPEESLLAAGRRDELNSCVEHLAPMHREVVALIFFHGLSYAEAAEVLEVPVGTVKSRLYGARRALKAMLEDSEYGR
ncbi:sigma-70 family RNA polymerase sigma factor [Rubrobacter tropicus]|uniref:RNA polymerase sigma factor n=1 Tax=Rubrobacter tropicus TaxID=2653851 RepID=A0A6G8QDE0_9ACTN|nr:sigma-70 family RNA polymerase sigma factor [Rubrobacter tropicus]QIN84524.1 sigma-70 family RNA polymerase sigma factor [Rubrobacter tropicus]